MLVASLLYTTIFIWTVLSSSNNECYDAWECQSQELTGFVLCYGYQSCQSSSISTSYYVPCSGYKSCMNANIKSTSAITCDGDYACSNAQLSSPDALRCHGNSGCYSAEIDAVNIIANGAYALHTATIDSINQIRVNVYSKGHLSGMNANIICRSGKMCNIYCEGTGCQDLNIGCLAGSKCMVSPSTCNPVNANPESIKHVKSGQDSQDEDDIDDINDNDDTDQETVVCPNWYLSNSKNVDNLILTRFDEQRLDVIKKKEESDTDNSKNIDSNNDGDDTITIHSQGKSHKTHPNHPKADVQDENNEDNDHNKERILSANIDNGQTNKVDTDLVISLTIIICFLIVIGGAALCCIFNPDAPYYYRRLTQRGDTESGYDYKILDGPTPYCSRAIFCYMLSISIFVASIIALSYNYHGVNPSEEVSNKAVVGSKGIAAVSDSDVYNSDPVIVTPVMKQQVIGCDATHADLSCDDKYGCYTFEDDIIAVIHAMNSQWIDYTHFLHKQSNADMERVRGCFGGLLSENLYCTDECTMDIHDPNYSFRTDMNDNANICKNTFLQTMTNTLKPYRRSCLASLITYQFAEICDVSTDIQYAAFNWWKISYQVSSSWTHDDCPTYS